MAARLGHGVEAKEQAEEDQHPQPLPETVQANSTEDDHQQVHRELAPQGPTGTVYDARESLMLEHQSHVRPDNISREQEQIYQSFDDLEVAPVERSIICTQRAGDEGAEQHRQDERRVNPQHALCEVLAKIRVQCPARRHKKPADDKEEADAGTAD